MGFLGLSGDRFALPPLLEGRRVARSLTLENPIPGVPRLDAMSLGGRVAAGDFAGATVPQFLAAERERSIGRMLASGVPPLDWHVWVDAVREAEETRAGGSSGARGAMVVLTPRSARSRTDVRGQLLTAWIRAAERGTTAPRSSSR